MKFNISNPQTGCNKSFEVDDEKRILPFYEKRIGAEVAADTLGDEFKGYVFKITGGNDREGFPMFQGVLVNHRVRLLFRKGMKCFRERRRGQMKRKSVRGCIVGPDISALNVSVVQKGDTEVPGLTDTDIPARLGPKRASKIRKLFNLAKDDDVTKYVIKREVKPGRFKSPKIQRLITPDRLRRKQRYLKEIQDRRERSRAERSEYEKLAKAHRESRRTQKTDELKQLKETLKQQRDRKIAQKKRVAEKQKAQHDQRVSVQATATTSGH